MNKKGTNMKFIIKLLNLLALLCSIAWVTSTPDWEPLVAAFGLLATYLCLELSDHRLIENLEKLKLSSSSNVTSEISDRSVNLLDRMYSVTLISDILRQISAVNGNRLDDVTTNINEDSMHCATNKHVYVASIISFLRDLGFVKIDNNQLIRPASKYASYYLQSIRAHLLENICFISDWSEVSSQHPKAQVPRAILKMIEERRVGEVGKAKALAIRRTKVVIAFIKGKIGNDFVYLTQLTSSGGISRFHFIGGNVEECDFGMSDELEVALYREMNEELNINKSDVFNIRPLCTAYEKEISNRLGVLSEYDYHIYFVQLKNDSDAVSKLLLKEHVIETHYGRTKTTNQNKWQSWFEIKSNLTRYAPVVISAIDKADIDALPVSVNKDIMPVS